MTRYFVDSNVFLRLLVKEDRKTLEETRTFFSRVQEGTFPAFTSSLVLAEVNWVLGSFYTFSKEKIVRAIEGILNLKYLKIEDATQPLMAAQIFRDTNIKFIDALIASHPDILEGKTILVSYDKDFDKIRGVKRKEPLEI